jgi:hypothetical protein
MIYLSQGALIISYSYTIGFYANVHFIQFKYL